ncbi:uncharacterized protein C13orf46 homolog [Molossus nigricans]
MEKEATTMLRRHRPGAGAPALGAAAGHLKGTSEGAELQRSRSVGGLHQKGDPPSCIQKLCKELAPLLLCFGATAKQDESYGRGDASAAGLVTRAAAKRPAGGSTRSLAAPHERKPSMFVEIDLGDHAEEVVPCARRGEMHSQMDMGDLSEDEARTSWLCCIPYSTRKKVKESA